MTQTNAVDALLQRVGGRELLFWHRRNGVEISASEYLARNRRVLVNGLGNTKRTYLDTNYWIQLRDAQSERSNAVAHEFLRLLRSLVQTRRAICVNHYTSFSELAKQEGMSLRATATLVDELTEGVAIAPIEDLRYWEAGDYIASKIGIAHDSALGYWTKIGQIIHSNLSDLPSPAASECARAIYKAMLDSLWNANLQDIFAQFNLETKKVFGTNIDEVTIAAVESRKKDQLAKRWVLDRVRRNEFAGVLRNSYGTVFTEQIAKMNIDLQLNTRGFSVAKLDHGLLVASYRDFVSDSLGTYLPSAVIPTELYALYEHDASRKLSSNDWNDLATRCCCATVLRFLLYRATSSSSTHENTRNGLSIPLRRSVYA